MAKLRFKTGALTHNFYLKKLSKIYAWVFRSNQNIMTKEAIAFISNGFFRRNVFHSV